MLDIRMMDTKSGASATNIYCRTVPSLTAVKVLIEQAPARLNALVVA